MEGDGWKVRREPTDQVDEVYRQVWRDQGRYDWGEEGEGAGQDPEEQGKAFGWETGPLVVSTVWRAFRLRISITPCYLINDWLISLICIMSS